MFEKGKSGNPGGRPKRTAELAAKISEMDDALRVRLELIATQGEHRDSVAAIKLLWAYAHGNPTQPISGPGDGPIQVEAVDALEALRAIAKAGV